MQRSFALLCLKKTYFQQDRLLLLYCQVDWSCAGQRGILEPYRLINLFPSFRAGFTAIARDESRHVLFGVKFLRDMIQRDHAYASVVQTAIEKYATTAVQATMPTNLQIAYFQSRNRESTATTLNTHMRKAGIVNLL